MSTNRCGDAALYSERQQGASEAALLIAANRFEAAEALLRDAIATRGRADRERLWLMLLDLLHISGRRDDFERLAARHGEYEGTPERPQWGYPLPIEAPGTVALSGVLAQPGDLHELAKSGYARKTLAVDMSEVSRISFEFLPAVEALLRNFSLMGKRVIVANLSEVNASLLEAMGSDRHVVLMRRKALAVARLAEAA